MRMKNGGVKTYKKSIGNIRKLELLLSLTLFLPVIGIKELLRIYTNGILQSSASDGSQFSSNVLSL